MWTRRGVLTGVVAAVMLAAGLTFVASAVAEIPNVTISNTGGVPTAGTQRCIFTLRLETCRITVTNNSVFEVQIREMILSGPEAGSRYSIRGESTCSVGRTIASRAFCEVIVQLLRDKPACARRWQNGLSIRVLQVGKPENTLQVNQIFQVP